MYLDVEMKSVAVKIFRVQKKTIRHKCFKKFLNFWVLKNCFRENFCLFLKNDLEQGLSVSSSRIAFWFTIAYIFVTPL